MIDTILQLENITKTFPGVKALDNVKLDVKRGEVHALMGENGAGKSTLMNIISGSLHPNSGIIRYEGKEVSIHSPTDALKLGIAMIHQELHLVEEMSIAENIYLGREFLTKGKFVDYNEMYRQAKIVTDTLDLEIPTETPVKALRTGEKQLVEIAKAVSINAKIIIMDEPTSALSKNETDFLFKVINDLKEKGITFIYITHRMEEVFQITDRITIFRDGTYVNTVNTKDTTNDELIKMMVGREVKHGEPENFTQNEIVLDIKNLSVAFDKGMKKTSLHDISFNLKKGEVLGIAGLMGAGRSELFETLFGLYSHHRTGTINLFGKKIALKTPKDAIKNKMAFLTEDRKGQGLVLGRSIGENMSLPILEQLSPKMFMNTKQEQKLWQEQMDNTRIKAPTFHTLAGALSGGNQQKIIFGRWLLTEPEILLLDEPTRGIDVGAKSEIYKMISSLAQSGKSIIVISSELPELLSVSNRIITLCEGHLTGEFSRHEANQENLLKAATLTQEKRHEHA